MITQEILEAHKEGKLIQFKDGNDWIDMVYNMSIDFLVINEFRIKPIPYKKEHNIWLNKIPKPESDEDNLKDILFGYTTFLSIWPTSTVNKRFKITVEEVIE